MPIPLIAEIKYTGLVPKGMKKRVFNDILREAYTETGRYWHERYLPDHFTVQGARKYGYKKRKGEGESGKSFWKSYSGQKKKYKGHMRPLVFSGEGETQSRLFRPRATKKGVAVILPRKFNYRHPNSEVNMREEITATTPDEIADMQRFFEREVQKRLDAMNDTEQQTIRS